LNPKKYNGGKNMANLQGNVGRILIGDREVAYCEGIEVDYDASPIKHYAGDRQYPVYIGPGNSELTITIDCAEFAIDEDTVIDDIFQNYAAVTVTFLAGVRGGGFTPTTLTNCVVVHHTITSRQGDVVKAKLVLNKQADS
jgi:hypothetical protein